jgi:hypothetical protein
MRRERDGAWRRPGSRSKTRRPRRSAREPIMRRTTRLKTVARRADPRYRATNRTNGPRQDKAQLRGSGLTAPANPALIGSELHNERMSYASRRPWDVNRRERRRTEQTYDEREREKAVAG